MACNLIAGYEILCRDAVGGVAEVYITEFDSLEDLSASNGVLSAIELITGKKFWTYKLEKENATYTNDATISVENGTTFWTSTLSFTMKKMSASMKNGLKVLAQARLLIIVKDSNGIFWLMGQTKGVDATTITITSGKAFGDMSGSTITFTGKEPDFDNEVPAALIPALLEEAA